LLPQQTTALVPARIAQLCASPRPIFVALPLVPFTVGGGVDSPMSLSPQHTTAPLLERIAQLWKAPAEIADAVPLVPFTVGGGVA
jgi:hypothetical protein